MSALTLALREKPAQSVDCAPLAPDLLVGKGKAELEAIELASGRRKLKLAELFEVRGDDAQHLVIAGATDRLIRVGSAMKSGTLRVEGDCGAYLGAGMRGGRLAVTGSVGEYAGGGMRGGSIDIAASAGDFLGAALPGERQGMRGGRIVVRANAGDRVGDRMRRGLILVQGAAGEFCGARMLAGTIVVSGKVGRAAGFALKRGTLILARQPAAMLATFAESGIYRPLFLTLLEKRLRLDGDAYSDLLPLPLQVRRYCGDLATGGAGEILVRA